MKRDKLMQNDKKNPNKFGYTLSRNFKIDSAPPLADKIFMV